MERVLVRQRVTVVELASEYDTLNDEATRRLEGLVREQCGVIDPPLLVFDMSRTKTIGSTFVSVLFRANRRLRQRDGHVAVCCVASFCAEVLDVVHAELVMQRFDTLDEAVEELSNALSSG